MKHGKPQDGLKDVYVLFVFLVVFLVEVVVTGAVEVTVATILHYVVLKARWLNDPKL